MHERLLMNALQIAITPLTWLECVILLCLCFSYLSCSCIPLNGVLLNTEWVGHFSLSSKEMDLCNWNCALHMQLRNATSGAKLCRHYASQTNLPIMPKAYAAEPRTLPTLELCKTYLIAHCTCNCAMGPKLCRHYASQINLPIMPKAYATECVRAYQGPCQK